MAYPAPHQHQHQHQHQHHHIRSTPTPPPASKLPLSRSLKQTRSHAHLISKPSLLSRSTATATAIAHYPPHPQTHPHPHSHPHPKPILVRANSIAPRAPIRHPTTPLLLRQRSFSPALSQSQSSLPPTALQTQPALQTQTAIHNLQSQPPINSLLDHTPNIPLAPPPRPKPAPPLGYFYSAPSSSASSSSDYSFSSIQLPSPPSSASPNDSLLPSRTLPTLATRPKARFKPHSFDSAHPTSPLRIIKKPAIIPLPSTEHPFHHHHHHHHLHRFPSNPTPEPRPLRDHARSATPGLAAPQSHPVSVLVRIRNSTEPPDALLGRPLAPKTLSYDERTITLDVPGLAENGPTQHTFTFDKVLGPSPTSQERLFEDTAVEQTLLDPFLAGTNASLIAYGQTGAGKSYTMGTARGAEAGLVPRTLARLFSRLGGDWSLAGSFIEVYNDELVDLGAPGRPGSPFPGGGSSAIAIREAPDGTITWAGARSVALCTLNDAMGLLRTGLQRRATGATGMNNASSRSHAILCLQLVTLENGVTRRSKFMFVDLAGSERVSRTGNVAGGERFKEGVSINAGLHALGNVICALGKLSNGGSGSTGGTPSGGVYVPYRESKLTRLLQDSLGGNSKTVVIGCVSADVVNAGESLSTLRYASRAKRIKNNVTKTIETSRVKQLEDENQRLRLKLERLEGLIGANGGGVSSSSSGWVDEREEMLRGVVYEYEVSLGRVEREVEEVRRKLRESEKECEELRRLLGR